MNSCNNNTTEQNTTPQYGIILENMDTTVSPKDDFYNYVNGNWMLKTEIPEDQVRSVSYTHLTLPTTPYV